MAFEPPTFSITGDPEAWKNYLANEGYVVLTDILSSEEQVQILETFKQEFALVSPNFNFSDPTSWTIENTPAMFGKGMAIYNGFGQSDFMWKLRTHSNIQAPFKELFKTGDLVTSLDGFSIFVSDKQKSKSWLHIDQNPKNDIFSIQSAYNLFPVGQNDAGFVVVPKSHKSFRPEFKGKADWHVVDQDTFQHQAVKLLIHRNCLTLWNSRLVHANAGMTKNARSETINRITAYISFQPKSTRPAKAKEARENTYYNGKTTSHWSNRCEVKTYPFGFKTRYESRGFNALKPRITSDNKIPAERHTLL